MKSDLLCYSRLKSSSPGGLRVGAYGSLLTKRVADLGVSERTAISHFFVLWRSIDRGKFYQPSDMCYAKGCKVQGGDNCLNISNSERLHYHILNDYPISWGENYKRVSIS